MKILVADFEFHGVTEPQLNLVSCATTKFSDSGDEEVDWWLHDDPMEQMALADYLTAAHAEGYIFVAFGAEAEARSCIALGLDPVKFNWICEHLEYRCLQNHSYELLHGEQLIDGKVKRTYPFGEKGKQNLGAVTFKLLGKIIDTKEKDEVRQLIISSPTTFTEEEKQRILSYGRSDVRYLDKILKEIVKIHVKRLPGNRKNLMKQMLMRGNYAARTAKMVALGYPVNVEWLKNFAANAPMVLQDCARDINRQFPDNPPFRWHKAEQRFALTQKVVRDWIHAHHPEGWELTETGQYSLSADAFAAKYSYRHDYPEGHLGAQIMRFKKLEQSLRGYNPHAEKSIFNDLGSDGRVRTYLNPYGAQSSRSQAGSTGFIFLKPAFQRTLVQPPKGKCIGDCDWSSEEFLLAALMSGDRKMIEAYKSGDVYLAFGKDIGFIPQHGTKKTHKRERDICKAVVLSLSYLMTKYGLAARLTDETGEPWTEDMAEDLIKQFDENYEVFSEWRKELIAQYEDQGYLMLPDGWSMWGNNEKFRSVGNMPVQGMGACVLRKAVTLAQDAGLNVIFTLHDAIYIEYDYGDLAALDTLKRCMDEAFVSFFDGELKELAKCVRVDPQTWGIGYDKPIVKDGDVIYQTVTTPGGMKVAASEYFIDPRAAREFDRFSKYMLESSGEDLLG